MKILFRADGNKDIGMGHIFRCLALADGLKQHQGFLRMFFLTKYEEGVRVIREKGYPVIVAGEDDIRQIEELAAEETLLITDFLDTDTSYLGEIRKIRGLKLIAIDNNTDLKRLDADIVINANVFHDAKALSADAPGYYLGPKYMVLNSRFNEARKAGKAINDSIRDILIMSGGADSPNGHLTISSIRALERIGEETRVHVIIGPAFAYMNLLDDLLKSTPRHFDVHVNPADLVEIMQKADIAITAAGIALFELATLGVPCIVVPQVIPGMHHQLRCAEAFERRGACLDLGQSPGSESICAKAALLIKDASLRKRLSDNARAFIDGRGLERVLGIILEACGLSAG